MKILSSVFVPLLKLYHCNWCELIKERNTKLNSIFMIWHYDYLKPILNVLPERTETPLCCWWARVKVVVAELLKRLVMSARGTLFLGFGLLWFFLLTLLVLHAGGTFSLLLWSIVIVAMSLASICNKFVRWWILGHMVLDIYIYCSMGLERGSIWKFWAPIMEAMEFVMLMAVLVNSWLKGRVKNETLGAECIDDSKFRFRL